MVDASLRQVQHPIASTDEAHIRASQALIMAAAELAGLGNAAVLGCGRCGEIPIRDLGRRFNRVDLVDLDAQALKDVAEHCRLWAEVSDTYTFYEADLTGLIAQIEPEAQEIVMKVLEPYSCLDELGRLLASTPAHFWSPPTGQRYHLIVCSGILTQLQATVRARLEAIFLNRFPDHSAALASQPEWRNRLWRFARQIEDGFITHLVSLATPEAIIYLADTVQVCWLLPHESGNFVTEGAWLATRTSRLADYLQPSAELITERRWPWLRRAEQGPYWGRLYGVQAIIYRLS